MKDFSIVVAGRHATSISLEEEFYKELLNIAKEQNLPLNRLVTNIDKTRTTPNLSSAIRVYILKNLREKLEQTLK